MNFIYFGRLAKEKGFDLIIQALAKIVHKTGTLPGNVALFGDGDLHNDLFQAFGTSHFFEDCSRLRSEEIGNRISILGNNEEGSEKKIYFFGWQSQSVIRSALQVSHFSLMPSRFLETFGLSALESLSEGVPVIGFQKGGLVPFITDGLAIPFSANDHANIEALSRKLLEVSVVFSPTLFPESPDMNHIGGSSDWKMLSNEARYKADTYTEERWMKQIRNMLPKHTKKILLVSDYTTILGGIETHIHTIAKALRHHGYEVEIFGWNLKKGPGTKLLRMLGLLYSYCNITSALGIRKKIREYRPDVIWLHSVSRFLGPLVITQIHHSEIFSMITYHDLGLFAPFPSKVENEEMIPKKPCLAAFVTNISSCNPLIYLAIYCKYFQVYILRKLLRDIDMHIVPSAFLAKYVQSIGGVSEKKVGVLEHFL